eukprot:CAMPEP_0197630946 /NCGR_PEP_ID=MMETSP1338-20131121/8274_1 /TAXON_ID=43686 ORGANISM="Pelagodinium beii, Strain RCC1491" /NCGR_SAMPLE_ID=MMETSP1338 /ASSEMBLY_ACC=CAM_ASM_000754 /LENGTH=641 /DNA_ID=CAMNT_0043202299 /DNA_START=52 /DNA_END=1974 /DNA_ORIENTATION=-
MMGVYEDSDVTWLQISTAGFISLGALAWWSRGSAKPEVKFCPEVKITWGATIRDRALQLSVKLPEQSAPTPEDSASTRRHRIRLPVLQINVYGKAVPRIAGMFLPLQEGKFLARRQGGCQQTLVLDLGWVNPKRETILSQLRQLEASDAIFILEIFSREASDWTATSLCVIPLRPSVLRKELEAPQALQGLDGPSLLSKLPASDNELKVALEYRPRAKTVLGAFLRLSLCPSAVALGAWMLLFHTQSVLQMVPQPPNWLMLHQSPSLTEVLPPMPTSLLQAYDAGVLCQRLQSADQALREELLGVAAGIFGRPVTSEELLGIRNELLLALSHQSLAQKVLGFFTFVNTMWLAAIAGIAISIGPVLWHLAKPLRQVFVQLLCKIQDVLIWLLKKVLLPLCSRLHEWGFWELLLHTFAFLFTAHSARMQSGPSQYVALSGLVACVAAAKYSEKLHGQNLEIVMKKEYGIEMNQLVSLFMATLFFPSAVLHGSKLLGFIAAACLLAVLGFRVMVFPFCYVVGWDSEDAMVRTSAATAIGLVLFHAAALAGVSTRFIMPFSAAISILGGIGHYLALLIRSNKWYHSSAGGYVKYNLSMLASLCASQLFGRIYGVHALANTSTTFFVLWGLEKSVELHSVLQLSGW